MVGVFMPAIPRSLLLPRPLAQVLLLTHAQIGVKFTLSSAR
jgi:hypothetical protein